MKRIFILALTILLSLTGFSQVANYGYTSTTSTWATNSVVSPSTTFTLLGNSQTKVISTTTNIGFNFVYNGVTYTQYKASSSGFLTFNTASTAAQATNKLATSTNKILAVIWDSNKTGLSGNVNYRLSGTSPNRILTVEWLKLSWISGNNTSGTISTQIKLYETTNVIEYIYDRSTTGATYSLTLATSASIGLCGSTAGDFISLSDLKASPTKSTTVETSTIGTSPVNFLPKSGSAITTIVVSGTTYRFTPPAIALPIDLLYFKGVPSENHNHITWSTASEHNNNYFEIETTIDGIEYHTINRVSGSGNSNTKIDYEFDDYNIGNDINYYKLKQTDYDGKFRYSDLISIDNRIRAKIVSRMVSLMGTEVNEMYRGVVIVEYTDGSIEKIIR